MKPLFATGIVLMVAIQSSPQAYAGVLINFDSLETSGSSFETMSNPLHLDGFQFESTNGSPATFEQSSAILQWLCRDH
ncbi:MAG: hypothetical protein AAFU85_25095 [Planctomycetota bacterium]